MGFSERNQIYDFTAKRIGFVLHAVVQETVTQLNVAQTNTMLLLVPDPTPAGLHKLS